MECLRDRKDDVLRFAGALRIPAREALVSSDFCGNGLTRKVPRRGGV